MAVILQLYHSKSYNRLATDWQHILIMNRDIHMAAVSHDTPACYSLKQRRI